MAQQAETPSPSTGVAAATVEISDSVGDATGDYAAIYFVAQVNRNAVYASIEGTVSRRPAYFSGPNRLSVGTFSRTVPSGKVRLKLEGKYVVLAPIVFLHPTTRRTVSGEVDVELKAQGSYRVTGVISQHRQEIWLEDTSTREVVPGSLIKGEVDAETQALMRNASFTCCNLRGTDAWISDTNGLDETMIPAGTPIVLKDYGRYRAYVIIDGREMQLGQDYGRKQESREAFAQKWIVKENPRLKLEQWPADVREAVQKGRVRTGMTREQVVMSWGFPRTDMTPSMDAPVWTFFSKDHDEVKVHWTAEGRVGRVESDKTELLKQFVME